MKRLFIAIKIPSCKEISNLLISLKNDISNENIKWVESGNLHITLKFLGNTEEYYINTLILLLEDIASKYKCFTLQLQHVGIFKKQRNPRVIWIGTEHNDQLLKLANNIDMNMSTIGFERENRPFKAHLTLGRVKGMRGMNECIDVLQQNSDFKGGRFLTDNVLLIKSELKATGAVYTPLEKIKLEL